MVGYWEVEDDNAAAAAAASMASSEKAKSVAGVAATSTIRQRGIAPGATLGYYKIGHHTTSACPAAATADKHVTAAKAVTAINAATAAKAASATKAATTTSKAARSLLADGGAAPASPAVPGSGSTLSDVMRALQAAYVDGMVSHQRCSWGGARRPGRQLRSPLRARRWGGCSVRWAWRSRPLQPTTGTCVQARMQQWAASGQQRPIAASEQPGEAASTRKPNSACNAVTVTMPPWPRAA